jgi:hypothetical protein
MGVRVYAETENVIYGWVTNEAAIGHGFIGAVKQPQGTKFVLTNLMQDKPEVCWCAYTAFHSAERLDDKREIEVMKVVETMRMAGRKPS